MRFFLLPLIFSICVSAQDNSVNCDSLYSVYYGCYTVYKMPELIGGMDSLQTRLVYPNEAIKHKIEGKVYILAAIDTSGNPICAKVIKGLGYGCDEEALRLVKTSKFFPGIAVRKPVTMLVSIPVVFSLHKK